jgi:hypothetical protein
MSQSDTPVRNDGGTVVCGVCGSPFAASGRRRWCSDACRQAAFRIRRAAPHPAQPAKPDIVYECPNCDARYLGQQRCQDCNCWCRRLGPGGPCPHCDELVVIGDLLRPDQLGTPAPSAQRSSAARATRAGRAHTGGRTPKGARR